MMLAGAAIAVFAARADTEIVDGIEWTYIIEGVDATVGDNSDVAVPEDTEGTIVVPARLGGYDVTRIGDSAFSGCASLTGVTIPEGITAIGGTAFFLCTGLRDVEIASSVTSIGSAAFGRCSGIRYAMVPQCVCSVKLSDVFPNAYAKMTNVVIADSVTSIGYLMFDGCAALASVSIPDSVSRVGERSFNGCPDALFDTGSVVGAKLVDGWAIGPVDGFSGDIVLAGVRGIADYAFDECGALTGVTVDGNSVHVGEGAFCYCTALTNVVVGAGVASIGDYTFCDCINLSSVVFQGNAPLVGVDAFDGVADDCIAYVHPSSTGWGVSEGEKWKGLTIRYIEETDENVYATIVEFEIARNVAGIVSMIVGVVATNAAGTAQGDAAKVAALFNATSDLGDWDGAAKLTPTVEVLEPDGVTMRFRVTPGDGTATSAFLRIRR